MNKQLLVHLSWALGLIFIAPAVLPAALMYDPFPYSNGNLDGNTATYAPPSVNGFSNTNVWTTPTAGAVKVIDGDLTYPGLPTTTTGHMAQLKGVGQTGQNLERIGIGEYPVGSTIYFSMILQVPTGATFNTTAGGTSTGSFLSGFQYHPSTLGDGAMNSGTNTGGGVIVVHTAADLAGYNLGIAVRDAPAGTTRIFDNTQEYKPGDVVFLVGKYVLNPGNQDDVAKLYLNPDPTAPEPAVANAVSDAAVLFASTSNFDYLYNSAGTSLLDSAIRSFFLRSNSVEPSNMNIDEVRVASTWEGVTQGIPEPMSISMIALAAFGVLGLRHQRRNF